ncbi:MAG: Snf7 family protein [Opitutales bacterium]|nr:Snf7 family protein [Opitutales bacterium]
MFTSKAERDAKAKVAMRMGKNSIQTYINSCRSTSRKYIAMAKKSLHLGQRRQGERFAGTSIQYEKQADKWEGFMLKLDDIVLRGQAMQAMTGLMGGISQMCKSIGQGLSDKQIAKTMFELETSMVQVDEAEERITGMMASFSPSIGTGGIDESAEELPAELREEAANLCDSLMDEVRAEESSENLRTGRSRAKLKSSDKKENRGEVDELMQGLEKVRKRRKGA